MLKGQLYKLEAEEMRAEPRPGAQLLLITAHAADRIAGALQTSAVTRWACSL